MDFILSNLAFIMIPFIFMTIVFIGEVIRQNQLAFVLLAVVLSILAYEVNGDFLTWTVMSGHFSLALMLLVIFAGMFPKKTMIRDVIEPVRGDLAIYAVIYVVPHFMYSLPLEINGYNLSGILAILVMLPLIVTSFRFVRHKLKDETFYGMHKLSYLVYALLYVHAGFMIAFNPFVFSIRSFSFPIHLVTIIYLLIKLGMFLMSKTKASV